jgi:hypothetical protein
MPPHCKFNHHPKFVSDLDDFIGKSCSSNASSDQTITYMENLLGIHFFGNVGPQFSGKHFGQAQGFGAFTVYFLHMAVPNGGLSRTKYPKAYLLKYDDNLCFLCLDSHITNYKDSKLRKIAEERINDILVLLKGVSSK